MSVQVRRRREAAAFLSTYVGAQGELLVDTTNNRVQVHDGTTPGGWPAAKLADVIGRTAVADAAYAAKASDRTIAFTSLTAPRTVTLPAAATYPTGTVLTIVDESGACATLAISVAAAGTETINGLAAWPIASAFGYAALESNGVGRWTVVDAPGTARTAVADAAYTALATDRTIAFTALTAARTVTLPSASAYPTGTQLLVVDESGACSATLAITIARAGTDTINGGATAVVALAYGYVALETNGVGKWTIVDQSTAGMAQQAANAVAITGGTIGGASIAATTLSATGATTLAATTINGAIVSQGANAGILVFDRGSSNSSQVYRTSNLTRFWDSTFGDTLTYDTAGNVTLKGATTSVGALTMQAPLGLKSYTVATLPAAGTVGRVVHCSNARMFNGAGVQEASGAGTGGTVTDNGSAWKLAGTNSTAIS